MSYSISIQNVSTKSLPFTQAEIKKQVALVLKLHTQHAEISLRFVTPKEMIYLNHNYRKLNKTTNVLAFPCTLPLGVEVEPRPLGDIVICPQVLLEESLQLNKTIKSHYALIIIHGVLHLLGYDHIKEDDTNIMQGLEIQLLAELGFNNPYDNEDE